MSARNNGSQPGDTDPEESNQENEWIPMPASSSTGLDDSLPGFGQQNPAVSHTTPNRQQNSDTSGAADRNPDGGLETEAGERASPHSSGSSDHSFSSSTSSDWSELWNVELVSSNEEDNREDEQEEREVEPVAVRSSLNPNAQPFVPRALRRSADPISPDPDPSSRMQSWAWQRVPSPDVLHSDGRRQQLNGIATDPGLNPMNMVVFRLGRPVAPAQQNPPSSNSTSSDSGDVNPFLQFGRPIRRHRGPDDYGRIQPMDDYGSDGLYDDDSDKDYDEE